MARTTVKSLESSLQQEQWQNALLSERLAHLELALEDRDWLRATMDAKHEFSREGLGKIIDLARAAAIKNPLIRRALKVSSSYVFGQGIEITSDDEAVQQAIGEVWWEPSNQRAFCSLETLMELDEELAITGNVCLVVIDTPAGWRIRTFPAEELAEVVTNPGDADDIWWYRRAFARRELNTASGASTSKRVTQYLRSLAHDPTLQTVSIGSHEVPADRVMYHVRAGGQKHMLFGVPEIYSALDWAKAHTDFLSDCATIMRALSRFAHRLTVKGGSKQQVQAAKRALNTTLATGNAEPERNPPPVTGSTFVGNENAVLEPLNVRGASISPEDGRQFKLQVCAATDLPETMFGDVSTGNLATAKSLDRPTQLRFEARQRKWRSIIQDVLGYIVANSQANRRGGVRFEQGQVPIQVSFPPVVEASELESVEAIAAAWATGRIPKMTATRLLLSRLSVEDIQEQLAQMEAEDLDKATRAAELQQRMQPLQQAQDAVAKAEAMLRAKDARGA